MQALSRQCGVRGQVQLITPDWDYISGQRTCFELVSQWGMEYDSQLDNAMLAKIVLKGGRALWQTRRILQRDPHFSVLVIANQHLSDARGSILAAREFGVPSIYIPHAPLADNVEYADLPTDWVGLRGIAEFDYYSRRGAIRGRTVIVGDPSQDIIHVPSELSGSLVLALSPWPPVLLKRMMRMVDSATAPRTNVVLAPHPRSNRRRLRKMMPPHWDLWEDSTQRLLDKGPRAVIQHSSGVSWDALRRGIPTVELRMDQKLPNYPAIQAPYVHFVSTVEELQDVVRNLDSTLPTDLARDDSIAWARRWCAYEGAAATERAVHLVRRVEECGQAAHPVLDFWGMPGGSG